MKKENLVVSKLEVKFDKGHSEFRPNHFYRCLPENGDFLIYGEWFTQAERAELFETVHERMLRQFESLGLIVGGKPISKTAFVKQADIHTYGRGNRGLKIWFFRNSRNIIWVFYPMQGAKAKNAIECYNWFLELIEGNMESIDSEDVCFGDAGIPLSYGKLRIW